MKDQIVILTWEDRWDMDVVRNSGGDPLIFDSAYSALEWIENNDNWICKYHKLIDLVN